MSTTPIRGSETDLRLIVDAIRDLQQGRSNAHGSFTLTGNGAETSLVVSALTCASGSNVNITPTTANAAAVTGVYVVAANEAFTVHHAATGNPDCTFTWSING